MKLVWCILFLTTIAIADQLGEGENMVQQSKQLKDYINGTTTKMPISFSVDVVSTFLKRFQEVSWHSLKRTIDLARWYRVELELLLRLEYMRGDLQKRGIAVDAFELAIAIVKYDIHPEIPVAVFQDQLEKILAVDFIGYEKSYIVKAELCLDIVPICFAEEIEETLRSLQNRFGLVDPPPKLPNPPGVPEELSEWEKICIFRDKTWPDIQKERAVRMQMVKEIPLLVKRYVDRYSDVSRQCWFIACLSRMSNDASLQSRILDAIVAVAGKDPSDPFLNRILNGSSR